MSSVMSSHSVILTTAMAVSGAVIFLSLCRIKNLPTINQDSEFQSSNQISSSLRSCLSTGDGKRRDKKKKRVKFADDVKDEKNEINGEKKTKKDGIFRKEKSPEFRRMPANRAALYHGILRDRVHRTQCSY